VSNAEDEVKKGKEEAKKLLLSVNEKYDLVKKKAVQGGHLVAKEVGQGGQWAMEKGGVAVDKVKDSKWAHHLWYKNVKEGGQM